MSDKDERLLREQQEQERLRTLAARGELLQYRTWWLADSSYQPQADKSVYVYVETGNPDNCENVLFVLNNAGLYYTAFYDLGSLICYLGGDLSVERVDLSEYDVANVLDGGEEWCGWRSTV